MRGMAHSAVRALARLVYVCLAAMAHKLRTASHRRCGRVCTAAGAYVPVTTAAALGGHRSKTLGHLDAAPAVGG